MQLVWTHERNQELQQKKKSLSKKRIENKKKIANRKEYFKDLAFKLKYDVKRRATYAEKKKKALFLLDKKKMMMIH